MNGNSIDVTACAYPPPRKLDVSSDTASVSLQCCSMPFLSIDLR